jgi:5-methylcytosine-specific restriction endonuclease McrA
MVTGSASGGTDGTVPLRRGRCRRHLRELLLKRGRSDRDGWFWSRTRARVLRRDPVCRRCHERPSAIVHHVVPVEQGGSDREGNLIGVCRERSDELHYGIS